MKFTGINYLIKGNSKQRSAYEALQELQIIEILKDFDPIVVGTIPIDIDINQSDIDIICNSNNLENFEKLVKDAFGNRARFKQRTKMAQNKLSSVSSFEYKKFEFEIFAQNLETVNQNAYRHMLIEYRILQLADERFKREVIKLKEIGIKTEEAFANLLGLSGDPYKAILKLENENDEELIYLIQGLTD